MPTRHRAIVIVAALVVLAIGGTAVGLVTTSTPSGPEASPALVPSNSPINFVSGALKVRSGPYFTDRYGRIVFLHGVNAVYKRAPFELYPAPGKPWNFNKHDAAEIASFGFNVVRLGIIWQGLQPGSGGINDPSVCKPGQPTDPAQPKSTTTERYLANVARTVNLLGRYHIYTLLDMHQDLYSSAFGGEGAPLWAVCTNGLAPARMPGRWSNTYADPALDVAEEHFWTNNTVGNLQGAYDLAWKTVAQYFRNNPWVVGYDPVNEPFTVRLMPGDPQVAVQLECFYTGTADPGLTHVFGAKVKCPATDPAQGLIPTLESVSSKKLIFYEPDIFGHKKVRNTVGPMDFKNLVYNFHSYCGSRNPVTGDPIDLAGCAHQEISTILRRADQRADNYTLAQPQGPAWFMSEFGATQNVGLVTLLTAAADRYQLGWTYWDWKYYNDPTGSSHEALVGPSGTLSPVTPSLVRVYPQAVAGVPRSFLFDPSSDSFVLHYLPRHRIRQPTVIFVPVTVHYPAGYCAVAVGGRIISHRGATHLLVANDPSAKAVTVTVQPGSCRH